MLSSVPVCRIVGTLRFRLSSRPSPRLSFRPSARLGVSGLLRLVRSSRVIVSQGVSFHPIVLVASSVLPCSGPCLIERGVNVSFLSWVSGASCRRLFCSHSRRSLARRRFPQLRFPSEISVDCPGSSCGMTWTSSSPPAFSPQPPCLAFPVGSYRLLVRRPVRRPVCRSVSSPRLGVPFPLSCPLSLSASSWERSVSFAWRFRSSISIRAVFVSSISPSVPHCDCCGRRPSE